jgi:MYXO-CTERM domain-containing protein
VTFGLWAFLAPQSFFEQIALWRPYNAHFLHDIGAFQIGSGAVLILALIYSDALLVALGGVGIGSAMHALAHVMDAGDGGKDSDSITLGVFALVLLAAAWSRRRALEVR